VLIDGEKLAELMIDYGIGVTIDVSYEIKRLDAPNDNALRYKPEN